MIDTAPVPLFTVMAPKTFAVVIVISAAVKLVAPAVTVPASVMLPVMSKVSGPAVLAPVRLIPESSWIETAPAELKVTSVNAVVIPPPPIVMAVPANVACVPTLRLVEPSVIAPAEVRPRLRAVLAPARAVSESS